ncbi:MAG: hypothetical protein JXA11_04775 [Phycisphaerae bacterium]|nr:hypothetical protein [Phycisphaerae bacterium]
MNTTKRTMIAGLILGLFLAAGCEQMSPKGKSKKDASREPSSPQAGPAPSERANFPGGCLVVKLDGKQTREAKKENNEQIWAGEDICPTPTLEFTMDENTLGKLKSVSLVIQPMRDGAGVEGDIYQYSGTQPLAPGQPIVLNQFTHVKDGKLETDLRSLPVGAYRIGLQVHGQKHWDRQRIDVRVKK